MTDLKKLQEWDDKITEFVKHFGLHCYTQEFEIADHFEMIGYMAYSGMPSRYSHWSFGKSYEREKMMYDYGVGGLPYEMVINTNPCLAYLMRDNTELLQILTIAHVYGHNDFFANNFTFQTGLDAKYTFEMFKSHSKRVKSYIEDPSIGIDAVERILDSAHALSFQRSTNLAIKKEAKEDQLKRLRNRAQNDNEKIDFDKHPLEPEQNILEFIADNSPALSEWERDLIRIVDKEASYFIPQMETKIMNEGWASYWHYKIVNALGLDPSLHLEFLVRHNQVLRPTPGGLNPYHLGFIIWNDIEKRWNNDNTGMEYQTEKPKIDLSRVHENDTPGRKKIFQVREADRDRSFLRRFLTKEIMQELDLFQHEKRGKERVITKVSDEESWEDVKNNLVNSVGTGSIPRILIQDADFQGNRILYIKHEHDGRDLQLEYAEKTLQHLNTLWGKDVYLETNLNSRPSVLRIEGHHLKIDKI